ncbi:hypothetical protein VP01_1146g1 [Puccinia sorghi]|uniref:Uncharacterized protein n=1 Tax=Puccinia sorghi TaxID=27349 RepID=A0A0L6VT89_9BASI|nr:hypothetical protein VP01_1146g1 [Puccinia sorghi]
MWICTTCILNKFKLTKQTCMPKQSKHNLNPLRQIVNSNALRWKSTACKMGFIYNWSEFGIKILDYGRYNQLRIRTCRERSRLFHSSWRCILILCTVRAWEPQFFLCGGEFTSHPKFQFAVQGPSGFGVLQKKLAQLPAIDMQNAPAKLSSKLLLIESTLEKGWSINRSFLGVSGFQLQAVEQVSFAVGFSKIIPWPVRLIQCQLILGGVSYKYGHRNSPYYSSWDLTLKPQNWSKRINTNRGLKKESNNISKSKTNGKQSQPTIIVNLADGTGFLELMNVPKKIINFSGMINLQNFHPNFQTLCNHTNSSNKMSLELISYPTHELLDSLKIKAICRCTEIFSL